MADDPENLPPPGPVAQATPPAAPPPPPQEPEAPAAPRRKGPAAAIFEGGPRIYRVRPGSKYRVDAFQLADAGAKVLIPAGVQVEPAAPLDLDEKATAALQAAEIAADTRAREKRRAAKRKV